MTRKSKLYLSVLALILPLGLMAQATITGSVTSEDGSALAGANVIVEGTSLGAAADASGNYNINGVSAGNVTVTASFVGYESSSSSVSVPASGSVTVNFSLSSGAIALSGLEVLASRATSRTPVAYTNVDKEEMEFRMGSQDIPMILNTTPSVYATQQGGGAGDARINVRGFNQRNVAVMINGVPQNDMENGWVYWSN
jgi:outer membrane cobalamin receptor